MSGEAERGAWLLGAPAALMEAASHRPHADERVIHDYSTAAVRRQLTDDEFRQALQEGLEMSMGQAIVFALQWTPPGPEAAS